MGVLGSGNEQGSLAVSLGLDRRRLRALFGERSFRAAEGVPDQAVRGRFCCQHDALGLAAGAVWVGVAVAATAIATSTRQQQLSSRSIVPKDSA